MGISSSGVDQRATIGLPWQNSRFFANGAILSESCPSGHQLAYANGEQLVESLLLAAHSRILNPISTRWAGVSDALRRRTEAVA